MKSKIRFKGKLRSYLCWPLLLTLPLILADIGLYFYDVATGIVVSGFIVIYFTVEISLYYYNKPHLTNEIINFATQYATVQKRLLNEFEIPYALLDYTGKILWVNEQFSELTGVSREYHKSITTLFSTITREFLQKNEGTKNVQVTMKERIFRISLNRIYFDDIMEQSKAIEVDNSEEFLTALYLFDETELSHYKQENQEQKQVAGLVYIDNYDEALDSIEDVKRSLLIALVDRKVNQYFAKMDALVRKIEKDKYFVVFKYKYLKPMMDDKFSILEDVKTVKVGNEMAVTLSIGIGIKGSSYNASYEHARENVIIMGHSLTDVDSLGAGIGIFCAAKVLGKKAQIVINDPTSSIRPLMECFSVDKGYPEDMFITSEIALEMVSRNTLVMVVDTNRPSYTECPELLKKTDTIVVFDHHRQNSEVIENPVLSYIEPYASSACEMVAEVLQYFQDGFKLSAAEADCIYAGILIDTNNFMTKTGVRTFEAAAYLKRSGAEVTRVRKMLRNDMACYKARAEAVRHAEVYRGAFAISVCPSENVESPTIVGAQAANELLNIIGIKASFVLTEYNGKIYISSRSIDEINVQLIMERLGGGGHLNVAGAQLKDCTIVQAKHAIMDTLDEMLKEGDIQE